MGEEEFSIPDKVFFDQLMEITNEVKGISERIARIEDHENRIRELESSRWAMKHKLILLSIGLATLGVGAQWLVPFTW